ncbi:MAG: indole-3-glycerol-phosphate synthase [candidate division KSB1 bacterium]|nr:indole-3-glycerol-phosphate synthase [candidate division KSB1 bacterium]
MLHQIAEIRRWDLEHLAQPGPDSWEKVDRPSFYRALSAPGLSLIAEIKRQAPSAGPLRPNASVRRRARAYELGGATAISVLTEPRFFAGSFHDLREAAQSTQLPILCKDFVVDRRQIQWATRAGASCVLLIAGILPGNSLRAFIQMCREEGLESLVEVFTAEELDRALDAGAEAIGINSRDLRDFSVRLERVLELRSRVPKGILVVAESGVRSTEDLRQIARAGFDGVLVGTALMRSPKPGTLLRHWREGLVPCAGEDLRHYTP